MKHIDNSVMIAEDALIYDNVYIKGNSKIESGVTIYPFTYIENSIIKKNTVVYSSHIFNSIIGCNNTIGPYAHIRSETETNDNCKIGSFVETKKINVGKNSKIPHLSYMGDTLVGTNVNIGCGVITANYDGINKHQTIIEDNSFVGCNSVLIAPVKLCKNSFIAAGSVITEEVPDYALGIARSRQVNKSNYIKH